MNPRFPRFAPVFLALLALGTLRPAAAADPAMVSVAAAANLVHALEALNAGFRASAPDVGVTAATGASGNLVAQIRHGAPYDVFLSADLDYPRALVKEGLADTNSLATFATGRLVLWTTRPASVLPLTSVEATVRDPAVRKLALANRETAPYGRAAQQALVHAGLWPVAQPKVVTGENITQTAQFVETGNADAGFVALSLVLSPQLKERGRWLEIPADWHEPLAHGAVLTKRGAKNPAAQRYLRYLASEPARKILRNFGYAVP